MHFSIARWIEETVFNTKNDDLVQNKFNTMFCNVREHTHGKGFTEK